MSVSPEGTTISVERFISIPAPFTPHLSLGGASRDAAGATGDRCGV